jgi:hypothetical protein
MSSNCLPVGSSGSISGFLLIVPNNLYAAARPSAKAAMQGVALPNDLHKMVEIKTMDHKTLWIIIRISLP